MLEVASDFLSAAIGGVKVDAAGAPAEVTDWRAFAESRMSGGSQRLYADALGLQVLDENGKLVTVTMGSYGIGPSRAVAAIAEGTLDELGLCWPRNVAPADVHLVATGKDEEIFAHADRLARELADDGVTVLYDDRPKGSPGV